MDRAPAGGGLWRGGDPATGRDFGERREAGDGIVAQGAQRWVDVVSRVEKAGAMLPGLSAAESWRLALEGFAEGTRFGSRIAGAIELGGWLEVLWADAPRLILAGANEGRLPESVSGDAFLPEALRERLGLKTNAQRLAVDAYLWRRRWPAARIRMTC